MTCPVCLSPMLKAQRRPDAVTPSRLGCTQCTFHLILRGRGQERPGRPERERDDAI